MKMTHLEAERKAWDGYSNLVQAITQTFELNVWFTMKEGTIGFLDKMEDEIRKATTVDSLGATLNHVDIIYSQTNYCHFTLRSTRLPSDVVTGYQFLKLQADKLGLDIHYESV